MTAYAAALAALLLIAGALAPLPSYVRLSAAERRALERGDMVTGTLPGPKDQVAVFAITRTNATGEALIAAARAIEEIKRSSFVTAIHRFSDPPVLADLDGLVLSPRDVEAALACSIGACSFKLTADEIATLRRDHVIPGENPAQSVQDAFREVVLARVMAYLDRGLPGLPPIVNRKPFRLDQVFESIVTAASPISDAPCAMSWLRGRSSVDQCVESFVYWSHENYGAGKPVIAVTHVGLVSPRRAGGPWLVLGKQIFATRYMTGGLGLTAITADPETGQRYLVYVNRTGVDLFGGLFGSVKRSMLEARLKGELPDIVGKLRTRLERVQAPVR